MEVKHVPDWIEASSMLREAMEQYKDQNYYSSIPRVIDDLIDYIEKYSRKLLNEKTIKRDAGNRSDNKKMNRIPDWRIRIYTKWLYDKVGKDRNWITAWLDTTAFNSPGKLFAEISDSNNHGTAVKTNVPSLKTRLWGSFLGRQEELQRLQEWADHQRYPIAILYGFGGSGKTTVQQKFGEDFVYGVKSPLRWPYEGVVWISAVDYLRGQPGLVDVLRKIAEVYEVYTSLIKQELRKISTESLKEDVKKLLEKKRILVLLDNFETISRSNQIEILQFFSNIRGSSQILISTRYRPDWFLENNETYSMAYVMIRIEGLSNLDAGKLIQEFLSVKELPQNVINDKDIIRLTEITQNNPKVILALLGLVEQGVPLLELLGTITSGTSEADRLFDMIIDHAWEELFSENDKAVLMAKAFFSHSVSEDDLGKIAGVYGVQLRDSIKKLSAISFFEPEHLQQKTFRIRTHALSQEFAKRILHDHPNFQREAEERWWTGYGPMIVGQTGQTPYKSLHHNIEDDAVNILEHIQYHIHEHSLYYKQALLLFGGKGGLGHILFSWSRYDDILRLAESIMELIVNEDNPEIIGRCCLHLFASSYISLGRLEEAERWIGLAVEQNARLKDRWLEAMIETLRGYLHSYQGYLLAQEQAYQKALAIFTELESIPDLIKMYKKLGSLYICIASHDLEEAIDTSGKSERELVRAEHYFDKAETLFKQEKPDKNTLYEPFSGFDGQRGIITRIRGGDLKEVRKLIQIAIEHAGWSSSVANFYCELALVEHLAGNINLAHSYEKKGTMLLRQLGVLNFSKNSIFTHCKKVIGRMKQADIW